MLSRLATAVLAVTLLPAVYAQTFTSCNPLNETDCPLDTALGVSNYSINFDSSIMSPTVWNTTAGTIKYGNLGAEFTIAEKLGSPTIQSNFYILFGQVEVHMRAAPGQGVISSIVMESDDLDEIDWEIIGSNTSFVETNYFGKGNTTAYDRAIYYPVNPSPQSEMHNYTLDWSAEKIDWYIDSQIVRTLKYNDANGGKNFPQTPMYLKVGIWPAGDPKNSNYTIEWAGGPVDYGQIPFTMYVQSVRVSDASTGTQYQYGDETGSWQSIQVLNTTKALKLDGNNASTLSQTTAQKWNSMSSTTKIAILASVGGALAISALVFAVCCMKQRRAGKREKLLEDAKFEKDTSELLAFRSQMAQERAEKMSLQSNQSYAYSQKTYGNSVGSLNSGVRSHGQYGYARSANSVDTRQGYQRY